MLHAKIHVVDGVPDTEFTVLLTAVLPPGGFRTLSSALATNKQGKGRARLELDLELPPDYAYEDVYVFVRVIGYGPWYDCPGPDLSYLPVPLK